MAICALECVLIAFLQVLLNLNTAYLQVLCPTAGPGGISKTRTPMNEVMGLQRRAILAAVGNFRQFDASKHSGCDMFSETNQFMTSAARRDLNVYGPLFYTILDAIAPSLGRFGKEIMSVRSADTVDAFLAKTVT